MANADFIALSRTAVPLLLKANAELKEGRDSYKKLFGEYAECLQKLCMGVLYEACKPVSHKWPGKPHTETIVEGVNYLLSANMEKDKRIAELEAQRDQAREIADDVVARISDLERQLEEAKTAVSWLRGIAPPCPADNFGQGRWLEAMDAANKFLQRKE